MARFSLALQANSMGLNYTDSNGGGSIATIGMTNAIVFSLNYFNSPVVRAGAVGFTSLCTMHRCASTDHNHEWMVLCIFVRQCPVATLD